MRAQCTRSLKPALLAVNLRLLLALLEEQGNSRVLEGSADRYGRMLVSPFTFFRGAALIMAADLAATARSGLNVQSGGRAPVHLRGVRLTGAAVDVRHQRLRRDLQAWEWDLKRLGASLEVAGRDCRYSAAERRKVVLTEPRSIGRRCSRRPGCGTGRLVHHSEVERLFELSRTSVSGKQLAKAKSTAAKARTGDTCRRSPSSREVDGERRIIADRPLIVPVEDLLPEVRQRGEVEAQLRGLICSTGGPWRPTAGICWRSTSSSTWPGR